MADTSGYKAIVFLYMNGGMDSFDTVLPYDQPTWNELKGYRGPVLVNNPSNSLKLNPNNSSILGGREIALPPQLPDWHSMFEAGEGAIIGNVGSLTRPLTDQEASTGNRDIFPPRLGSHNDQASAWQSLVPEGATSGWGGKIAQATTNSDPNDDDTFAAITTGSTTPFLFGDMVRQFKMVDVDQLLPDAVTGRGPFLDRTLRNNIGTYVDSTADNSDPDLYRQDYNTYKEVGISTAKSMEQYRRAASPLQTQFPGNYTGTRFRLAAEAIQIHRPLNTPRQVFFINVGGFDHHNSQATRLPGLHREMNDAIAAFRSAMIEIGEWDNVLIMTGSDFGRTLVSNGDGTDHAWGGHHFVFGGGVQGKNIYGTIPQMNMANPRIYSPKGILVPEISIEQYAATAAKWFGLTDAELDIVFPNLNNFPVRDLGFMG